MDRFYSTDEIAALLAATGVSSIESRTATAGPGFRIVVAHAGQ
jgi:hypothetical protein